MENKTEFTEAEKKELLEKIVALKQLPGLEINLGSERPAGVGRLLAAIANGRCLV